MLVSRFCELRQGSWKNYVSFVLSLSLSLAVAHLKSITQIYALPKYCGVNSSMYVPTPVHDPTAMEVVRIMNTSKGTPLFSPAANKASPRSLHAATTNAWVPGAAAPLSSASTSASPAAQQYHDQRSSPPRGAMAAMENGASPYRNQSASVLTDTSLTAGMSPNAQPPMPTARDNNTRPGRIFQSVGRPAGDTAADEGGSMRLAFNVTPASGVPVSSFSPPQTLPRQPRSTHQDSVAETNISVNSSMFNVSESNSPFHQSSHLTEKEKDQRIVASRIMNGGHIGRSAAMIASNLRSDIVTARLSVDPSQVRVVEEDAGDGTGGVFVPSNGIIADAIDEHHVHCEDTVRMLLKEYKAVVQERNLLRLQIKGLEENEAILRDVHERQMVDLRRVLSRSTEECNRLREENSSLIDEKKALREDRERLLQHIEDSDVEKASLSTILRRKWEEHLVDDRGGDAAADVTQIQAVVVTAPPTPPTATSHHRRREEAHLHDEGGNAFQRAGPSNSLEVPRKGATSTMTTPPRHHQGDDPLNFSNMSSIKHPSPRGANAPSPTSPAREFALSDVPQQRPASQVNSIHHHYHHSSNSASFAIPPQRSFQHQLAAPQPGSAMVVYSESGPTRNFTTESLTVDTERSSVLLAVQPGTLLSYSDSTHSRILSRLPAVTAKNARGNSRSYGDDQGLLVDVDQVRDAHTTRRLQPAVIMFHALAPSRGLGRSRADFTVTSRDFARVLCGLRSRPFYSFVPRGGGALFGGADGDSTNSLLNTLLESGRRSAPAGGGMVIQHELLVVTTIEPHFRRQGASPASLGALSAGNFNNPDEVDFYVARTRMLLLNMITPQVDDVSSTASSNLDSLLLKVAEGGTLDEAILQHRNQRVEALVGGGINGSGSHNDSRAVHRYRPSSSLDATPEYREMLRQQQQWHRDVGVDGAGELLRDSNLYSWFCKRALLVGDEDEEDASEVKSVRIPLFVEDKQYRVTLPRTRSKELLPTTAEVGARSTAVQLGHNHFTVDVLFQEDSVIDAPSSDLSSTGSSPSTPIQLLTSFVDEENGRPTPKGEEVGGDPTALSLQVTMEWDQPSMMAGGGDNNFEDGSPPASPPAQLSLFLNQRHVVAHAFPVTCCPSLSEMQRSNVRTRAANSVHRITSVQLPDHVIDLLSPISIGHRGVEVPPQEHRAAAACARLRQAGLRPFVVLPKTGDSVTWKV